MNKDLIFKGYDCVDNDYFVEKSIVRNSKSKIKHIYVVSVDSLKKNLFVLIKSFNLFKEKFKKYKNIKLKIAGSGPLLESLKFYIKKNNIDDIEFVGTINYKDLPKFYLKSNGMILLSTAEQLGLVTNEALNCGIPVLLSKECGSKEIIKENINGYIVNTKYIDKIALKIKHLIELSEKDTEFNCRESIKEISPYNFAIHALKLSEMNQK